MAEDVHFNKPVVGSAVYIGSTIYNIAAAAPPSPNALKEGLERFSALPLDRLPDVATLPSPSFRVAARNAQFVGHEADLMALAAIVKSGATAAVATGIGGIGKTQLAGEFAHRYSQFFAGGVFWLSFANADAIAGEIALCGGVGGLDLRPDLANLPLDDQIKAVAAAWLGPIPRLLIFDNCEDEELLRQWRPPSGGCRVVLTSRVGRWASDLGVKTRPIDVLSRKESTTLLRRDRSDLAVDEPALNAISASGVPR